MLEITEHPYILEQNKIKMYIKQLKKTIFTTWAKGENGPKNSLNWNYIFLSLHKPMFQIWNRFRVTKHNQ